MVNKPEKMPVYPSTRLVGVELEIDPLRNGRGNTNLPHVRGWANHNDFSICGGVEFVLEPPRQLPDAVDPISNLCKQLVNVNISTRGGMHVHVQVADLGVEDVLRVCKLYSHFQCVINKLVGPSRVNSRWCPAFSPHQLTIDGLDTMFHILTPAPNRATAKNTRSYSVANCAMFRCRRPEDRTIEFRQGSVSKKAHCVAGWTTMLVALVDVGATSWGDHWLSKPKTLEAFKEMFLAQEARIGAKHVADWVQWRYDYLNQTPTESDARRLAKILTGPKGLYTISRELDINLNYAKRLIDFAVEIGLIAPKRVQDGPATWVASYDTIAEDDLAMLEQKGAERMMLQAAMPAVPVNSPALEEEAITA